MTEEPFDDEGDKEALARMAAEGVDMTESRPFEVYVEVDDQAAGEKVAQALQAAGFPAYCEYDEGESDFDPDDDDSEAFGPQWTVFVEDEFVPSLERIVDLQRRVAAVVEPLGARLDGWGAAV